MKGFAKSLVLTEENYDLGEKITSFCPQYSLIDDLYASTDHARPPIERDHTDDDEG